MEMKMSVARRPFASPGGREARRALRRGRYPAKRRPSSPGMDGGKYKPLSERDMQRIHEAALEILETVGLGQAIPSCIEMLTARAVHDGEAACASRGACRGHARHVRARIRALWARSEARHGAWGNKVYFGTAGAAVHIVEVETRTYRESYLADLYDAARIVDLCDHIHFFQRSRHHPRHALRA